MLSDIDLTRSPQKKVMRTGLENGKDELVCSEGPSDIYAIRTQLLRTKLATEIAPEPDEAGDQAGLKKIHQTLVESFSVPRRITAQAPTSMIKFTAQSHSMQLHLLLSGC